MRQRKDDLHGCARKTALVLRGVERRVIAQNYHQQEETEQHEQLKPNQMPPQPPNSVPLRLRVWQGSRDKPDTKKTATKGQREDSLDQILPESQDLFSTSNPSTIQQQLKPQHSEKLSSCANAVRTAALQQKKIVLQAKECRKTDSNAKTLSPEEDERKSEGHYNRETVIKLLQCMREAGHGDQKHQRK